MDNNTEQSTTIIENKTQVISRKVWDNSLDKPRVVNVNAKGDIPLRVQMSMEKNKLIPTDYIETEVGHANEGKRLHIQKINNIIESKYI